MINKRVFVLGIDGAPPQFVFDRWIDELPNLKKLMWEGAWGKIQTTIPPQTCNAWTSFFSSKDASDINIYSYLQRNEWEYQEKGLINSTVIKENMIWDILTENSKKSYVIGVPITYPIRNKINGAMITDFMSPEFYEKSVYPVEFMQEVKNIIGKDYMFDVNVGLASYKNLGKETLLEKTYEMTRQQFKIMEHLIKKNDWDFAALVLIGSDRLLHTLWSFMDEEHRNYVESEYKNAIKDYFVYIDKELGKILSLIGENTTIIVSSDHGMDKMNFRFNLNDWLIEEGYLVLKEKLEKPTKFNSNLIDWEKTRVYSLGSYFGRIHINLKNREPNGIVNSEEYNSLLEELKNKLLQIKGDRGQEMNNQIYFTRELFDGKYADYAPDIFVYFDNLITGTNSEIGNNKLYSNETQIGKDDAGHAPLGIFVIKDSENKIRGNLGNVSIYDVMPTILKELNLEIPKNLRGTPIENEQN